MFNASAIATPALATPALTKKTLPIPIPATSLEFHSPQNSAVPFLAYNIFLPSETIQNRDTSVFHIGLISATRPIHGQLIVAESQFTSFSSYHIGLLYYLPPIYFGFDVIVTAPLMAVQFVI